MKTAEKILEELFPEYKYENDVLTFSQAKKAMQLYAEECAKAPALGGRSIQSEGPSASECEGDRPGGQRPDNQLLPQETTTQNIKTPTLQEIKDQVAQEEGWDNWDYVVQHGHLLGAFADDVMNKVAARYAQQLIEADRKDCAAKADTVCRQNIWVVDQDSILNRPLPKMI